MSHSILKERDKRLFGDGMGSRSLKVEVEIVRCLDFKINSGRVEPAGTDIEVAMSYVSKFHELRRLQRCYYVASCLSPLLMPLYLPRGLSPLSCLHGVSST
jgi:hypothetical protein